MVDLPRLATVVVVPRERHSVAVESLASVLAHTTPQVPLVYVDVRSPRRVAAALRSMVESASGAYIRVDRIISPNQARSLGLAHVATPYAAFVDNDLIVTPGWLHALVSCAEETGAGAVGPLYLQGDPADRVIHMAGGTLAFEGERPHRHFTTEHLLQGRSIDELDRALERERVGFVEFHCMLARRCALEEAGGLDQRLYSTREHLDVCLRLEAAGWPVVFEPASLVTYKSPPPVRWGDLRYFWHRWSDRWTEASLARFCEVYGVAPEYARRIEGITRSRRQAVFAPLHRAARRLLGRPGVGLVKRATALSERRLNRLLVRSLPAPPAPLQAPGAKTPA